MPYVPINTSVYVAAYSGAIAGMALPGWITNPNKANYVNETFIAGAFAQAFDIAWNNTAILNNLELSAITTVIQSNFRDRGPGPLSNTTFRDPNNWLVAARACVALVLECDDYFTSEGINPRFSQPVAANLATLGALPVTEFNDGMLVWVTTLRCNWVLRTSTDTPVTLERITSSTPGRVWERQPYPERAANPWVKQSEFYVNATTGNDENTGLLGSPIKTLAELRRRTWHYEPQQATVAYLLTNFAEPLLIHVYSTSARSFTVDGQLGATIIYTGAVTTFTAVNPATPEWNLMTDVGVANWTPHVGKRIRFTSGAVAGAVGYVLKANPSGLGVGTARVGPVSVPQPWNPMLVPAVGVTFRIENLPVIGTVDFKTLYPWNNEWSTANPAIALRNVAIGSGANFTTTTMGTGNDWRHQITGCVLDCYLEKGEITYSGCLWSAIGGGVCNISDQSGESMALQEIHNGAVIGPTSCHIGQVFAINLAVQGSKLDCFYEAGSGSQLEYVGVFDGGGNPFILKNGTALVLTGAVTVFGKDNALPCEVGASSRVMYQTKPTVIGPAGVDIIVGGTPLAWGGIPSFNGANGAYCGPI